MYDLALLICDPLVYFSYLRCVRPLGPLLDFYALCYTFYKYCMYVTLFLGRSIVVQLKCLKSSISTLSSPCEPAYNKLMLYVISVIKFDCPPNPAPKASPDLLSAHQLPVHSANTWDE